MLPRDAAQQPAAADERRGRGKLTQRPAMPLAAERQGVRLRRTCK